ncbi:unnamed protein product [Lactuca virosa]|uniref:Uncharacterized protein n=1 Tax=Lactuca virosa TaxID=75947 RepID=A0AAU9MMW9_9ASTR|nr:unnamed protein product [Lactuca virosa]
MSAFTTESPPACNVRTSHLAAGRDEEDFAASSRLHRPSLLRYPHPVLSSSRQDPKTPLSSPIEPSRSHLAADREAADVQPFSVCCCRRTTLRRCPRLLSLVWNLDRLPLTATVS